MKLIDNTISTAFKIYFQVIFTTSFSSRTFNFLCLRSIPNLQSLCNIIDFSDALDIGIDQQLLLTYLHIHFEIKRCHQLI